MRRSFLTIAIALASAFAVQHASAQSITKNVAFSKKHKQHKNKSKKSVAVNIAPGFAGRA